MEILVRERNENMNYRAIRPRCAERKRSVYTWAKSSGKYECTADEIREISSVSFGMATKKEEWPEKHVRRRVRKNERADYEPLNFPKEFNYKTGPWYTALIVSIKMSERFAFHVPSDNYSTRLIFSFSSIR